MFLHEMPFLRFCVVLCLGIICAMYFPLTEIYLASLLFGLLYAGYSLLPRTNSPTQTYTQRWKSGVGILFFFFGLGSTVYLLEKSDSSIPSAQSFIAVVQEPLKEKPKTFAARVLLTAKNGEEYPCLLYIQKDKRAATLKSDDHLFVYAKPKLLDFSYYNNKGIYCQAYVPKFKWKIAHQNSEFSIRAKAEEVRKAVIKLYLNSGITKENIGILSTLSLGEKQDLKKVTRAEFAKVGGAHVLAVSGLHLGIVYLGISFLLSFLSKNKYTNILKQVIIILALWSYAFICGLPPSVVRSSLMFSIIAVASIFNREAISLNTVFFTAFCMLVYQPNYLFDIGFQLSFSAVISILCLGTRLQHTLQFNTKIGNWAWSLCSISIAAQLGTMPLTLYYFHQFPTYFLLTNFIVIPAASLLIYLALLLIILSPLHVLSSYISDMLNTIIHLLSNSIHRISCLPYASIQGITIEKWQVISLFLLLIFSSLFVLKRKANYLYCQMCLIIALISGSIISDVSKLFSKFA